MGYRHYKVYCETENTSKDVILLDGSPIPAKCPESDEHVIDPSKTAQVNDPSAKEVVTQMEKNDKILRSWCAWADTNDNGEAEFCVPVPVGGRWVAYGDVEFQTRHFGDYVKIIEITDLDRLIAWAMAMEQDPNAQAPLDDAVVQANGYPLYPVLGHYDERDFPEEMPANAKGTIKPGMSMSFQYAITEAQPIGGYGYIPGSFYFRVIAQKADGQGIGHKCQISIDWAENE